MTRTGRIIIASTRASAGVYDDRSGPLIAEWFAQQGFCTPEVVVVPDGDPVGRALRIAVADGVDLVITSGGTGISPTDETPKQTKPLLDFELPGLAEAIRRSGLPKVPTAILSRGLAGVAGQTLIVNLPGSPGGVRDGLAVLTDVVHHAIDQLAGKDHPR
ncbi:MogA/MoaB family molybdenum cofactor biosynthesis protein [Mycolicibacterium confluentis]|uniref:Molybdenum cofactor biosynthesis protein n=1 Tax=Mycolicibacterium confluentis TaxID=28047 RepID=A0A7I7XRB4_9MYCO|nr:MogA/MoaB family molybdenum cofactor biosynthesis protein [Mycolicibacterium confluentis]MCV7318631.1 MogA/MoaB family molybdenum cofactor biosynthesis protein [Mycolicibacterium confluentis]ORV33699.1 molybdenum cofactor biosynthesis protein [Mycolicibacterium confluentis]BBZ31778.1 molybdenum cofactor biosynthesis protein [Mycolicibacterium confluentis]